MGVSEMLVSVCICTCKRPSALGYLLESLLRLQVPDGASLEFVIIDNDAQAGARPTAERFIPQFAWPVRYCVEPRPGVSQARNRCLSEAGGQWIAFVDDDEWIEPDWLEQLLACARRDDANVVIGPVLAAFTAEAPPWVTASGVFTRRRLPTGTRLGWWDCACGNALLSTDLARRVGGFDVGFGASGSEDTEFFSRCEAAGARMVWCDEAIATEGISPVRLTRQWVLARGVNGGRNYVRIVLRRRGLLAFPALWLRGMLGLLGYGVLALYGRAVGRPATMRYEQHAAAGFGKMTPWAIRRTGLYGDAMQRKDSR
ncbi:MAG: glycosyltransferase family 2 protein [Burkholderiaceae bacterium]|nr:glycosyltransferase family 2 protein [Roseateles sp.]MBV8469803.1 glycosyltransferase family 2 protein [Burkholderiaceae bacterium]